MSSEKIKHEIRKLSESYQLNPQEVLQMVFFEAFLERLVHYDIERNWIIKGGFLISSIIGIASRTTTDLDFSLRQISDSIESELTEIIQIDIGDDIKFEILDKVQIQKGRIQQGLRIILLGRYERIRQNVSIDLTFLDASILVSTHLHQRLLEKKKIPLNAYSTLSIIAEKFESIIHRGMSNSRMRDFYDVHVLFTRLDDLDYPKLAHQIYLVCLSRGTQKNLETCAHKIKMLEEDAALLTLWIRYSNQYVFTQDYQWTDMITTLIKICLWVKDFLESHPTKD